MSHHIDLKQSLEHIDALPAMPVIAKEMLTLALDTDEGEARLLKLIAQDPQISARVIGMANSSLFGAPGHITSVSDAAMRLGLTQVKSVAIGMAAISALTKHPEAKLKSTDLWTHSIAIASTMRTIAKHMPSKIRPLDDQIFLAGLLHDIGFSVINYIAKDLGNSLYDTMHNTPDASLWDVESDVLGTHHGEVGAQLGLSWGLPEDIITVIRHHHDPDHPDASATPLVRLVNIAEKMLPDFAVTEHTTVSITDAEWLGLDIEPEEARTIVLDQPWY